MAIRLAKREKYIISIGGLLVLLFFLLQTLIFPFFEKRERYLKGIQVKEKELKEIALLSERYKKLKNDSMQMDSILRKRDKGFTLFSFLERAAGEAEVKDHIKYIKPSSSKGPGPYKESLVEIKLEKITLGQLVGYLFRIEKPEDLVLIKRISINDNKKEEGFLDTIIQVLTFQ